MGWGMAVAMAAYAVGNMSGAHLNPALTVALAITGDFPWSQVPMYILAQFIERFLVQQLFIYTIFHTGKKQKMLVQN